MTRCVRCLYDETIPGITLDSDGICSFCHLCDKLGIEYQTGSEGAKRLRKISEKAKRKGSGKQYDVIVGVSGGCDSSYLLYIIKQLGLRPLAVHFDNTWNSALAVENIRNVVEVLDVDLYVHAMDREEYDDVCRSFLRSGVPDVDIPNDIALTAALYKVAEKHGVKYIAIGHSFRTEGMAPVGWSYMDGKYIESIQKQYGTRPLRAFPNLWLTNFLRWAAIGGIKRIRPLYHIDYRKKDAMEFLAQKLGWKWYGGHHLENQFTAFVLTYFLPKRYGIDKRILGYSALIRSGQMTREQGLELIRQPPEHDPELVEMVKKRLGFSDEEFGHIMCQPQKTYRDFRTYKQIFERTRWFWWFMYKLNRVPKSFYVKYTSRVEL
jgi:N-acetyl sugar amidotransferase